MPVVGVAKIAAALNLDERRVQQLVHEGMPRKSHGRYDLVKCMLFYIRFLQIALTKKCVPGPNGEYISQREQRVRLLRVKADLKELQIAEKRRQLISIAHIETEFTNLVVRTRTQLMSVPARVVNDLDHEYNGVLLREVMEKYIQEALLALSHGYSLGMPPSDSEY